MAKARNNPKRLTSGARPDLTKLLPDRWIEIMRSSCLNGIRPIVASENASVATMLVRFKESRSVYAYYGVTLELIVDFIGAPSIGIFYNMYVKGQYPSRGPL